jgi:hypothetical protein
MRTVTYHKASEANERITIEADDLGAGGASHAYVIQWDNGTTGGASEVRFQNGPISENGVNGVTNEALLAVVIDRLRCFQTGPFSCRENALALTKLEEAMHWLNARTSDRMARGVEGKNAA